MTWEEGKSGNAAGRPKDSKLWQDALKRSLKKLSKGKVDHAKLDQIAEKVINLACAGDMNAVQELANRLDGKATNFLVVENRTAFDDMALNELAARDKAIAERIERLQALRESSVGAEETGSVQAVH